MLDTRCFAPFWTCLPGSFAAMWTSPMRKLIAAVVALALDAFAGAAEAQNSPAAQRVIDRAREASGGTRAWNNLRGLHEVGEEGGAKIERWFDPVRYGYRVETQGAAGKLVQGFNGAAEWRILPSGIRTGSVAPDVLAKIRSEAFFGAYSYYFPSRFEPRSTHLGTREKAGRSFDVLSVKPFAGAPRELWFDRKTGLLAQMVEVGVQKPLTIEVSDYRRVGAVQVPFRFVTYGGSLAKPVERKLQSVDFKTADRNLFSLPPPAKS